MVKLKYCPKCKKEVDYIVRFRRFFGNEQRCPYCSTLLPRKGGERAVALFLLMLVFSDLFFYFLNTMGVLRSVNDYIPWIGILFIALYALVFLYVISPGMAR